MKSYKKILIVLLATCLLLGTGCIMNETTEGKKIGDEVLRCLNEDDTEGLKDIFCAETQTSTDLDAQIEAGMDFFDGKVTKSYTPLVDGGESVTNGETDKQDYTIDYLNIKTDTGKTYEVICSGYFICKDNPDVIGVSEIDIYDEDGNLCKIGECID